MIFRPVLAAKVLNGTKTETRRPAQPGELLCRYRPGKHYAVQPGRGKPAIGRILVEDVERQPLGALDDDAARREGFRDRDEFVAYWRALYRGKFDELLPVWAIRFRLMRPCVACDRLTEHLYSIDLDVPAFAACDVLCVSLVLAGEKMRR